MYHFAAGNDVQPIHIEQVIIQNNQNEDRGNSRETAEVLVNNVSDGETITLEGIESFARNTEPTGQPLSRALSEASSASSLGISESLENQRRNFGGSHCIPRRTDSPKNSSNQSSEEEEQHENCAIESETRKVFCHL